MSAPSAEPWLEDTRAWIEPVLAEALDSLDGLDPLDAAPPALLEAMRYATLDGGKRLRPALARLACRWAGGSDDDARAPAAAVELIHAYSLVHDDLPCMDDDDWRRGRPSCHAKYGVALALLAADALQTLAFAQLARAPRGDARAMVASLATAIGARGMVGGQVVDMALGGGGAPARLDADPVRRMHAMKTGALIAAAARLGAQSAGAGEERCRAMEQWAAALGRCFQAVDDVLDVTSDRESLGKTPGKDATQAKPTLVAALGLEGARAYAGEQADLARKLARAIGGDWAAVAENLSDLLMARRN